MHTMTISLQYKQETLWLKEKKEEVMKKAASLYDAAFLIITINFFN